MSFRYLDIKYSKPARITLENLFGFMVSTAISRLLSVCSHATLGFGVYGMFSRTSKMAKSRHMAGPATVCNFLFMFVRSGTPIYLDLEWQPQAHAYLSSYHVVSGHNFSDCVPGLNFRQSEACVSRLKIS